MQKTTIIWLILLLLLASLAVWYFSCRGEEIQISVHVTNENDLPLSLASVSSASDSANTDERGEATLLPGKVLEGDSLFVTAHWQGQRQTRAVVVTEEDLREGEVDARFVFSPPPEPEKKTGVLIVDARPPTAYVQIDGQAEVPVPYTTTLPIGDHSIRISADGYVPIQKTIALGFDTSHVVEQLKKSPKPPPRPGPTPVAKKGDLLIKSEPAGAALTIDGTPHSSRTPVKVRLEYGDRMIRGMMRGFEKETTIAIANPNQEVTLRFNPDDVRFETRLEIRSYPPGADIQLDGQLLQVKTPAVLKVEPGDRQVQVCEKTDRVYVPAGQLKIKTFFCGGGDCLREVDILIKQENYDDAAEKLAECNSSSLSPDQKREYFYKLGVCYYNARRYDDAVSTLEQFVNGAGRNHAMSYLTLAESFEKKNQYDDAIEAYEQVIKYKFFIPKSSRTKVLGDVAFSLAVCDYYRSNNTDDDEQQHRYRGNAVQGLKDFIEHYCAGNHPSCDKARALLNEIEREN
jgi:hypothetical protein